MDFGVFFRGRGGGHQIQTVCHQFSQSVSESMRISVCLNATLASGTTDGLITHNDQIVSAEKALTTCVSEKEAVHFKLYAMKTNHVYICLLSSQNVIFVNRSVKYSN